MFNEDTTMTEQQWLDAWAEWQAKTEEQRVEIVRAAFENNEPEPF